MLSLHIRDPYSLHGQIDVKNADNPDGYVIGQLYRYKNSTITFMIASLGKVETYPGNGHYISYYEVLQDGVIKGIRKKDLELALELGKIEVVR